jgi:predicted alpha-1,2-mannosidase
VFRISFPKYETESGRGFPQTRRIMITLNGGNDASAVEVAADGATLITGVSTKNSGGISPGVSFGHYFAAAIYAGRKGDQPIAASASHADSRGAWADFSPKNPASAQLTVRIGTSFISKEQALLNMQREAGAELSFEDVLKDAQAEWLDALSRVDVRLPSDGYSPAERQDVYATFYSALYRASLFPRDISEVDSAGQRVHWSPYAPGGPFAGPLAADSGFWDAYSTVYPLLSITNRPRLGTMIEGWLNAYREGGWLPKWASPGYRGSMVGTMGDVTLADAIVKKIPGFDVQLAYEAIRKDAFEAPPQNSSGVGRLCLDPYLRFGYVPRGAPMATGGQCTEVVSRNLLYLQADYAVSEAARALGRDEDADLLRARAANYGVLLDGADTGMLRSIDIKTGKFSEPFDQFSWGGDYTEAGPWQYRFHVPYDPAGLRELLASHGTDLCSELKRAQTQPGVFHLGGYGSLIHEQTEMMQNCWGQYAHNNQPVHHMLYMFIASDAEGYAGPCAQAGRAYLRRAQLELYRPGRGMFAGDEDNGQMASWFLLSAMGLYALSPGSPDYVLGAPLFAEVHVVLEGGASLSVLTEGNNRGVASVQRVTWNGEDLPAGASSISYHTLMQGGELKFYMK